MDTEEVEALSLMIPPPTMGWTTKQNITETDPRYAYEAENFFSNGATVDLRQGSRFYYKNVGTSSVESIFELALQSGVRKLLGVGNNSHVYDCTGGGTAPVDLSIGPAPDILVASLCNAVNFRNRIFLKDYGTSNDVAVWTGTGDLALPGFTGPGGDDKALCNPNVYRSRIYFLGFDASVWYGAVNAIAGTLLQFDFQSQLTLGGKLMYCGPTQKYGDFEASQFCVISDQGEVLVYDGDSPSATNWDLTGHYYMPAPIGYRSFVNWGANLLIITFNGVIPLSSVRSGENTLTPISDEINDQFVSVLGAVTAPGYCCGVYYPKGNCIIFNIPVDGTSTSVQFVMNATTGSWWKWSRWTAYHFCLYEGNLFFGGSNHRIFKGLFGDYDEDPSNDTVALSRTIKLRPAYNYLGDPQHVKQFTEVEIIMSQSEGWRLTAQGDVDFNNTAATQVTEPDTTDTAFKLYRRRIGLDAQGKCVSIRIDGTVTTKRMTLHAMNVLWNTGTIVKG